MDRALFKNVGDWSLTLAGLAGLQLPCLVSAASSSSPLAKFKSLGFPFNMSAGILNEHFSFSPENLFQGRYHTLVTNLFNHYDEQHLFNNMTVLIPNGYHVHRRFGRKHLLAAFLGGGIAGNLSQLWFYIFHQIQWRTVLPSPKSWGILSDFLGNKAEIWQNFALDKVFTTSHKATPCKGASAAVSSIVAIETCANVVSLYDKYKELRRRRELRIADDESNSRMMKEVLYEVCHLWFVISILLADLIPLFDSTKSKTLVAYSSDGIGHAAHIGGFLFGMVYYLVMLHVSGYRREHIR